MEVSYKYFVKRGKNLVETFSSDDAMYVYKRLAEELISKKINCCRWIKSIKRENLYNGFQRITVVYNNGDNDHNGRGVYIVKN